MPKLFSWKVMLAPEDGEYPRIAYYVVAVSKASAWRQAKTMAGCDVFDSQTMARIRSTDRLECFQ